MNWREIIHPETANVILGKRGQGKTGLAFFLIEKASQEYDLTPCLVNFPTDKSHLVPDFYRKLEISEIPDAEDSVILIDEGTTLIPAGRARLEEMMKSYQSLCRQRNQIILLIFHAGADVGSRILRGLDVLMFKRPSKRQIAWGSKDTSFKTLLEAAYALIPDGRKDLTLVSSESPDFEGILVNPLCSFWSDGLSKAWAGKNTEENGVNKIITEKKITRRMILNMKRREILDWAFENNLVIDPSNGMENQVKMPYCPMDLSLSCPCQDSLDQVRIAGKCRGFLFWKDYKVYEEVILKC